MFRIPLPESDAALLLTPRWAGLPIPLQTAAVLLCLLPFVLVGWLYRYELRLVSGWAAVGLLLFRLAALLLALFLIAFQPIVGRTWTEGLPGRVLVAVDRSDSMDVTDPQRPAADKLRLARALKLAGDLCSDVELDGGIRQYGEREFPRWVADDEFADEPERRRLLANDRQERHDKVCERVDALTRTAAARRLLAPDGVRLLDAVRAKHLVEVMGFAQDVWDVKPEQLDELFRQLRPAKDAPKAQASGYTDVRLPLEQALKRTGPDQGRILGVVLLTDGQHNWGAPPVKKAVELGEQK